jgi:hypothetical protein
MSFDNWYDFPDGDRRTKRPLHGQGTVINKTYALWQWCDASGAVTHKQQLYNQKASVMCTTTTNTGGKQKMVVSGGRVHQPVTHTHTQIGQTGKMGR